MTNLIVLHGRLCRDPELRYTQNQTPVSTVSIAVDRNGKDAGTDWIDIVAWRGTAELLDKYWRKGDEIIVSGRLQIREYQDKNGNKRKAAEVVADRIDFCGSRKSQNAAPEQTPEQPDEFSGLTEEEEERLPFR